MDFGPLILAYLSLTPSQNERDRWHWGRAGRARDDYCIAVRVGIRSAGATPVWAPIQPGKRRTNPAGRRLDAHVIITRHSAGELDEGNLVGGCKDLVDALVIEGLLFDDTREWCDIAYRQEKCARRDARVDVTIAWKEKPDAG